MEISELKEYINDNIYNKYYKFAVEDHMIKQ